VDFIYLDRPAIPIETDCDATSGGGPPPDGGSDGVVTRVAAAGGTAAADAASGTAGADAASGTAAADAASGTPPADAAAGERVGRVRPEVLSAVGFAIANAKALVEVEKAAAQQLEEEAAEEAEEVAAEEAPPPHVVYGLGRGPPPEPDAPPGLGVNSLGAFESWSRATTASWQMRGTGWLTESLDRPAAAAAGRAFRGACWSTVELRYAPVVLLLVSLVGSKRLRGVVHDRAMRQCRGRAVAAARAAAAAARVAAAGEAALSQSQADLSQSLSAREADLHHASAGEGLRARQAANASRPSLRRSPSPFDWRARLIGAAPAAPAATPGGARRDLRRSPSRTPSAGAAGRVR
jgi:hypothetical protein